MVITLSSMMQAVRRSRDAGGPGESVTSRIASTPDTDACEHHRCRREELDVGSKHVKEPATSTDHGCAQTGTQCCWRAAAHR